MELCFNSPDGPKGSEGDPDYIFFTLNTCQASFISDILWNDCRNWKKMEVWRRDGRMDGRTDRREVWNSYLDNHHFKKFILADQNRIMLSAVILYKVFYQEFRRKNKNRKLTLLEAISQRLPLKSITSYTIVVNNTLRELQIEIGHFDLLLQFYWPKMK